MGEVSLGRGLPLAPVGPPVAEATADLANRARGPRGLACPREAGQGRPRRGLPTVAQARVDQASLVAGGGGLVWARPRGRWPASGHWR
ncbi:hypothetical protein NL676_028371 [Syzygium grande]|nr:hypothetical protein NL676_028371 [Syzygium grande]